MTGAGPRASIVVLTGGVGGAKLVKGLAELDPELPTTAIVNTADDFVHLGLRICPDLDTLVYTLSGLADPVRGWGRSDESWNFMTALREIGGEDWFALGDRDLAIHVERTRRLERESLSDIMASLASRLGLTTNIVPMTDDNVATKLSTDEGQLEFQHYFVRRRCEPRIAAICFEGAREAAAAPRALAALHAPDIRAVIIAPSNPWLSVDPILAIPGLRDALERVEVPIVAVNPLPGGRAVKGPTAKIMTELGLELSVASIARHYGSLATGWVIDLNDEADGLDCSTVRTDTIMVDAVGRSRVARATLELAGLL